MQHVFAGRAGAQDDGDEFLGLECRRADAVQPLTWQVVLVD
jgi:hypothetical protein